LYMASILNRGRSYDGRRRGARLDLRVGKNLPWAIEAGKPWISFG
jgi:hypothetical protein